MLDLELLRSFVAVVEAGGFTRAAERVHRTQSTVSQQIKRLEDELGKVLLERNGGPVRVTEDGERLLSYARRLLSLASEARDVLTRPEGEGAIRLGVPEDFAACRLTRLLASFSRSHPGLRLDVRAALSMHLRSDLENGELDLALLKQDPGRKGGIASWPEQLHWVTSRAHPIDVTRGSIPLAGFPQGCLYRARAIHGLESAGLPWHMAFTSASHPAVQAAVAAGLGISILSQIAIRPEHQVLGVREGLPPIENTEVALIVAPQASPATRRLADYLAQMCTSLHAEAA